MLSLSNAKEHYYNYDQDSQHKTKNRNTHCFNDHSTKRDPTKMLVKNSNTLYEVMNRKKKATINQEGRKVTNYLNYSKCQLKLWLMVRLMHLWAEQQYCCIL